MRVQEVQKKAVESLESALKQSNKLNEKFNTQNQNVTPPPKNWQRNILLDALGKLEDNLQMDNSNPLNYSKNAPIETYREALKELKYIKTQKFLDEASNAQANINIEDVLSLFVTG